MKTFQIFRYINKGKYWIILVSVIVGVLYFLAAEKRQTYTASILLEYTYDEAVMGETPGGQALDVTEIYSAKVIQNVIDQLGLDDGVDDIRSKINVKSVMSEDEISRKEAILNDGEEYEDKPTKYLVTFKVDADKGASYANDVLDSVISNYISYFGEKYVSQSVIPNNTAVVSNSSFDYIEKADLIKEHIDEVLSYLEVKNKAFSSYRAAKSGYSFNDLYNQYKYIEDSVLPYVYVDILSNEFSQDHDVLVARYKNKIEKGEIDKGAFQEQINYTKGVMDNFAEKSKTESQAADSVGESYSYILQDIYGTNNGLDEEGEKLAVDRTTTYDYLIDNYADYKVYYSDLGIEQDYNRRILEIFSYIGVNLTEAQKAELKASIDSRLEDISKRLDKLYVSLDDTVTEFNYYQGSANLATLTSVNTVEGINIKLYGIFVVLAFLALTTLLVIVIGRIADFVDYNFWTDKTTGLPNRRKCDEFIDSYASKILPASFTCIAVKVANLGRINERHGRDTGDNVLAYMGKIMRSVVPENDFVVYNGNEIYLAFISDCDAGKAAHLLEAVDQQVEKLNEQFGDLGLEIKSGYSESKESKIFEIRKLLSETFKQVR